MKRLLTYLIPIIFAAVAFWCTAGESNPTVVEDSVISLDADVDSDCCVESLDFSFDLNIAPYAVPANVARVPNLSQRTNNVNKYNHNIDLGKVGRAGCMALFYSLRKESLNLHSTYIEPAQRLICLGKLII